MDDGGVVALLNIGEPEYGGTMATTVEIPDELLAEALRLTGLPTKKAVINLAMSELVQG
ncbi:type II toxin-antitoxin system VapB family antitoxin [Nocardia sp. NPDC050717]|uniref:type II toxin-antitoxin system VapB family antitoxin n=1 Tax=Nocardia sp. NPDC050717 TaxID=3157221 RepID=UPI0034031259